MKIPTNSIRNIPTHIKETHSSNLKNLKQSDLTEKIKTAVDFIMQVQPNWFLYLTYTAVRCEGLRWKYQNVTHLSQKQKVWKEAQLYSSTKVAGLIVSQVALTILGLTTPLSVSLILGWGCVLASTSMYAHFRAAKKNGY